MRLGGSFAGGILRYVMNENTVCGSRREGCKGE